MFNQMAHESRDRRIYAAEDGLIETADWKNPNDQKILSVVGLITKRWILARYTPLGSEVG
jgi:hypothetical protein